MQRCQQTHETGFNLRKMKTKNLQKKKTSCVHNSLENQSEKQNLFHSHVHQIKIHTFISNKRYTKGSTTEYGMFLNSNYISYIAHFYRTNDNISLPPNTIINDRCE